MSEGDTDLPPVAMREQVSPATTTAETAWSPHWENWAGLRPAQPARERRPPATTTAGTAWNAGLRPAQPAAGGRREGRYALSRPSVTTLRRIYPTKADGKEPPAALRAAVPAPTRRNVHDRVLRTPRRARKWRGTHVGLTTRHPPWFRAPARCRRRPAQFSRWGLQAVLAIAPSAIRALTPIRHHVAANLTLPAMVSMRNSA